MKKLLFILFVILTINVTAQSIQSGSWVQPTTLNPPNGECHIQAIGGGNFFTYFIEINNVYTWEPSGNFYNLAPGVYAFGFQDLMNGQLHPYPAVTLSCSPYMQLNSLNVTNGIKQTGTDLFGFDTNRKIF